MRWFRLELMKLLFITSTRVGDAILSTGILNKVITDNPFARVTIACGPAAAPLFAAVPNLEKIIVLDKMLFSLHWLRLWALCIGTFWDLVIDLRNAPFSFLLCRSKRLGMPLDDAPQRRVERLSRVLDLDHVPSPRIWTSEREESLANDLMPPGGHILAVGPTANWRAKTWRTEYFVDLIDRLTASGAILEGGRVAVFGRDDERPMALRLIDNMPQRRCIDLVGKLDLLSAYACLSRCSFYVGNDSGLMHLAAASGLPTLGLFGPTQESMYAPWGDYTTVVRTRVPFEELFSDDFDHRTSDTLMDSLTVDMAEQGAIDLWRLFKDGAG